MSLASKVLSSRNFNQEYPWFWLNPLCILFLVRTTAAAVQFLPSIQPNPISSTCSGPSVSLPLWGASLTGSGTWFSLSHCLAVFPLSPVWASAAGEIFAQQEVDINVLYPPHPPSSLLFWKAHHFASPPCRTVCSILTQFFPLHLFYHLLHLSPPWQLTTSYLLPICRTH